MGEIMSKLFRAIISASALLVGTIAANAADLRVKAPPRPVAPPPFSWSGFYIGGNLGGAWSHGTWTDSLFLLNFDGGNNNGVFIGGGQVGFNYQVSNLVFGVEGDFDWAANNNNATSVITPVGTLQVTSNNRWISTLAGRLGVAFDRVLLYAKGGGGWVGADSFTVTNLTTPATFTGGGSTTLSGWVVGGGLEWAFADNWSARVEYDYLGLNSRTIFIPAGSLVLAGGGPDTFTTSGNRNVQMLTVGLNYRFNWATPVVARY
jgi:outer membrane immunogenic protein